jgi:tagaturonate epimerase
MDKKYKEIINHLSLLYGSNYRICKESLWQKSNMVFFIARDDKEKYIGVYTDSDKLKNLNFKEIIAPEKEQGKKGKQLRLYKKSSHNLAMLRNIFPNLKPSPLGIKPTFGFGDRLGISTCAHASIISKYKGIFPVFAQQSVRELEKTKRTFSDVIESASWGVFEQGYKGLWGADADHLKDLKSFEKAVDAQYTMYTLDTSNALIQQEKEKDLAVIAKKHNLDYSYLNNLFLKYLNKKIKINGITLEFDEKTISELVITYAKAFLFTKEIFNYLKTRLVSFDFEISFDETDTVTSPCAHYFLSRELHDMKIVYTSLALRFPGEFYKGIDYVGNVSQFEESIEVHSKICKKFADYKLSLHSGSDKFSIYEAFARHTGGVFHVKTSGVGWLSAIETIAVTDPVLFREIYDIAYNSLEENLKGYHMDIDRVKLPESLSKYSDNKLPALIYDKNIRQTLHISYGIVLEKLEKEILEKLKANNPQYNAYVCEYLDRHLKLLG